MRLTPHPRLYVSAEQLNRLSQPPPAGAPAYLGGAAKTVAALAEEFKSSPQFAWVLNTHNAHLIRARKMQTRVVMLLTRWQQTGRAEFRAAALEHVLEMGRWDYWSWITWREHDPRPTAVFDLSYGENAMTLAIAYDWLHGTLTAREREQLCAIARKWVFEPFLNLKKPVHKDWWFQKPDTNWNTVCAGGAGMAALAFAEEFPREAAATLARAEQSVAPFFRELDRTRGGWPEGIGYWNYGMRYGFMYLLSWERATGKKHPLMRSRNVERTLEFPLDFAPSGVPCSFGDVNHFLPQPFHLAAAARFGRADLCANLDALLERAAAKAVGKTAQDRPNAADFLLLHPARGGAGRAVTRAGR
ncbi:MAG: hypothetical protein ACREJ2_13045, partial [Planctomycetota bacterium]